MRRAMVVPSGPDATTRGVPSAPVEVDDGGKITWNWFTPALDDWRYTSAPMPWGSEISEMLGRLGSRGWPRVGEAAWAPTVAPAKSTTGTATDSTNPRRPRMTAGGGILWTPARPRRDRRRVLAT